MEDTISARMTEVTPPTEGHEAEPLPLSQEILDVFAKIGEEATMHDLFHQIQHRGFGFLLVILAIPPAVPGTSGVATPFGILIALLCLQMVFGRDEPWLPKWVLSKKIGKSMRAMLNATANLLKKLERFLHPRFSWLYHQVPFRWFVAPILVISGLAIAIPLPVINSVAGIAVLLIGLGMLEEDGLFGFGGLAIAFAGIALAVVALYFIITYGPQGVEMFTKMIKGSGHLWLDPSLLLQRT